MTKSEALTQVIGKIKFPVRYNSLSEFVFDDNGRVLFEIHLRGHEKRTKPLQDAFGEKIAELINTLKP